MKPVIGWMLSGLAAACGAAVPDPRLREVVYDAHAVVSVPVRRGVVTLVVLGADEAIVEVASGLGADCARPDGSWCIAAQAGGRTIFVKPKRAAHAPNNLAVVTDRRVHNLRFEVLNDSEAAQPLHRLHVKAPPLASSRSRTLQTPLPMLPPLPPLPAGPSLGQQVADRLLAKPQVKNTQYSLAEGQASADIVPTLVFDDGRFTYLRYPGNREVPAVFHVLGDGTETLVNARMEDDLLVVDRVSRRLMLRAGAAVVGIWNEQFDLEGAPPAHGTTVPGLRRVSRQSHVETPEERIP